MHLKGPNDLFRVLIKLTMLRYCVTNVFEPLLDSAHCRQRIALKFRGITGGQLLVVPAAQAFVRQFLPRKSWAGIPCACRGGVTVAHPAGWGDRGAPADA